MKLLQLYFSIINNNFIEKKTASFKKEKEKEEAQNSQKKLQNNKNYVQEKIVYKHQNGLTRYDSPSSRQIEQSVYE